MSSETTATDPRPTAELYRELQTAYDHFNVELFDNCLPPCIITLQRKKSTMGYFSANRFTNHDGKKVDEIAMNPAYFALREMTECMQTLVHEMAHLWQHHFGNPGRGRYHNEEWSLKMQAIGLVPSSTGRPGGKTTGDHMSDYVFEGGPFDLSCQRLFTQQFRISWLDRFPVSIGNYAHTTHQLVEETTIALSEDEVKDMDIQIVVDNPTTAKGTVKYSCPLCTLNVWGKPNLSLGCLACQVPLEMKLKGNS